jgi:uncharacterized membrane protein YhaH (DUF805 family)
MRVTPRSRASRAFHLFWCGAVGATILLAAPFMVATVLALDALANPLTRFDALRIIGMFFVPLIASVGAVVGSRGFSDRGHFGRATLVASTPYALLLFYAANPAMQA